MALCSIKFQLKTGPRGQIQSSQEDVKILGSNLAISTSPWCLSGSRFHSHDVISKENKKEHHEADGSAPGLFSLGGLGVLGLRAEASAAAVEQQ